MNQKQMEDYANWLCWANDSLARQRLLIDFRQDYGDIEADKLEHIFDEREKKWQALTEVQREMYRNRQRVKLRERLHGDVA